MLALPGARSQAQTDGTSGATGADSSADEWQMATTERQGFEPRQLATVLDAAGEVAALRAVVVVRRGQLLVERYFGGASAADLQAVHSVTKSVCSMLLGVALAQGRIKSLDDTLRQLLPGYARRFADAPALDLTLARIITGHTGLTYDYRFHARALATAADPVAYAMQRPRSADRPAVWSYNDAAISLLAPVLAEAFGMPLQAAAQAELFSPLGIERHEWQHDRLGSAMAWTGLRLRPRDTAKLAWVMLNGGRWRERQVLPAPWVTASTRMHARPDWAVEPVTDVGYGQLWFTGRMHGLTVAWAWGYGAQFALLVPALELAVCSNASAPPPHLLPDQNRAVMAVVAQLVARVQTLAA